MVKKMWIWIVKVDENMWKSIKWRRCSRGLEEGSDIISSCTTERDGKMSVKTIEI